MAVLKGKFQKKEHRKQFGVFFGKGKSNSIEWNVSTGLAQVYALRFKYMNTTGKPIPVLMKFIDSKGVVLKEDVLNYISQSLGMVRAEALLPTVKDCAYSMLP